MGQGRAAYVVLGLLAGTSTISAQSELSPPLTLEAAKAYAAGMGVNPGSIFRVGQNRYLIASVKARSSHVNSFEVEIEVIPAQRVP
jgi:hypothetical protein